MYRALRLNGIYLIADLGAYNRTHPVPGDTRPRVLPKSLGPAWGLHLVDVNVALGNLVDLVRTQSGR